MISLSSRFPFRTWYSWYLRTPHARDQRYLHPCRRLRWFPPNLAHGLTPRPPSLPPPQLVPLTYLRPLRLGHPEKLPFAGAAPRCPTRSPWNSCFPMPPAEAMETSERSSTSLDASVSWSMTMNWEGSSSSKSCIGSVPGTTLVIMWSSSLDPIIRSSPRGPKYEVASLLGLTSGFVSASSVSAEDCCWAAILSLSCLDKNRGGWGGGGYSGASGGGGYACSWVGITSPSCLHQLLELLCGQQFGPHLGNGLSIGGRVARGTSVVRCRESAGGLGRHACGFHNNAYETSLNCLNRRWSSSFIRW